MGAVSYRKAKNTSATTRAAVPATRQRRGSAATTHPTSSAVKARNSPSRSRAGAGHIIATPGAVSSDTSHMALPVPHDAVVGVPLFRVEESAMWLARRILEQLDHKAAGRRGAQVAADDLHRRRTGAAVKDVVAARYRLSPLCRS